MNCPQCGLKLEETGAVRCPRCFKSLLHQGGCSGCGKCSLKKKVVSK